MKKLNRFIIFALITVSYALWSNDGPYVFWKNDLPVVVSIEDSLVIRDTLSANIEGEYMLDWSHGKTKPVKLQREFTRPATSQPKPAKILAISDMHGNLDGTVELLLAAGVMDENYNWIYDGCLIILGDVLDRGDYTTECLWLLYHLYSQTEENAQNKLIPILGNHETMTIQKRTHNMKGKYGLTCELLNIT